jgi:DNA-binding transcriptional LysR family regulator
MAESASTAGVSELPHLSTFAKAAEHGSFTAAAVELGITQAAVSQRIAALEKVLRVSLFDRQAGRIALTEAGQRLYKIARQILILHKEAREDLSGFRSRPSGDLPIAASSVPGECYLPALLCVFRQRFPDVHVRVSVGDSSSVMKAVSRGEATLGFIGQKSDRANLNCEPIVRDTLVLILAPHHPWTTRTSISLGALAKEPLIVREPGSGTRCALMKGLEQVGTTLDAMNLTLEMGSTGAIKDAVRRGLGISFVSRSIVERELKTGELSSVRVRGLRLVRFLYVVYHRRRPLSAAAAAFLHFSKSHLAKSDPH